MLGFCQVVLETSCKAAADLFAPTPPPFPRCSHKSLSGKMVRGLFSWGRRMSVPPAPHSASSSVHPMPHIPLGRVWHWNGGAGDGAPATWPLSDPRTASRGRQSLHPPPCAQKCSKNAPGMPRECPGNAPGMPREHSGRVPARPRSRKNHPLPCCHCPGRFHDVSSRRPFGVHL